MDWRKLFKPEKSTLTAREFGEQMYLMHHHLEQANKLRDEAGLLRGKRWNASEETQNEIDSLEDLASEHYNLAHEAQEKIGCVAVRFTGTIKKSEERWSKGTPGLIGSSHPYTHTWEVEVYRSLREVWFTIGKSYMGISPRVVGHMEYNGGEATFNPREVDIIFVGQQ